MARYGTTAGRRAARLARAAGIGILAVILALLIATLPPVDSGGGLVAIALADDGGFADRDGKRGLRQGDAEDDDPDADDDDQGEDGDRDDAGDDDDGGDGKDKGKGGGNGNGGGYGRGQPGGGDTAPGGDRGNKGGRGGEDGRERGAERDAGVASRDFAADSLDDRVPAAGASAALDALRATVLSADEEAAAIATGWTPAD